MARGWGECLEPYGSTVKFQRDIESYLIEKFEKQDRLIAEIMGLQCPINWRG